MSSKSDHLIRLGDGLYLVQISFYSKLDLYLNNFNWIYYWWLHSFIYSFIHLYLHTNIQASTDPSNYPSIYHLPIYPSFHPSIQLFIYYIKACTDQSDPSILHTTNNHTFQDLDYPAELVSTALGHSLVWRDRRIDKIVPGWGFVEESTIITPSPSPFINKTNKQKNNTHPQTTTTKPIEKQFHAVKLVCLCLPAQRLESWVLT